MCYEVIFPGKSVPPNRDIDFIVNVTNDAWYGDSPGPHQHLIIAKFRAIEEGIPVIRAANTGISSVVDSHGRILVRSKTFTQNILNSPLPQKLSVTKNLKFSFPPLFPTLPVLFLVLGVLLYNFKLIGRLNK